MTELVCLPSRWSDTAFTFTLPDSVTKIRCHAVNQVAQMTSFVCSENSQLKVIEGEAFEKYCEKYGYTFVDLETVDDLTYDGIIYKIENHTAVVTGHTDGIKTANIRKKVFGIPVTKIADNAFLDCTTLTSLTMPEGITEIGDMAFRECEALTGVIRIPDSVVKIGLNAFQRCAKVKEFDFGLSAEPNNQSECTAERNRHRRI